MKKKKISNNKKETSVSPNPKSVVSKTQPINPDFQQIQDLVKLINENNIGELLFEKGDYKISLKQKGSDLVYATAPLATPAPQIIPTPKVSPPVTQTPTPPNEKASNLITIKSPMIGTFYIKPAPDKADFVSVGGEIKKGQVLCIIEAMKLFNEIESEVSGKIVKILVNNASPIEFDQALFLVEPS